MQSFLSTPEIINKILHFYHLNPKNFAENIGTSSTQIYDLIKGRIKKISPEMASKIIESYPSISRNFLLTGEGDMFRDSNNISHNNVGGDLLGNGAMKIQSDEITRLSVAIEKLTETNQKQTEQISLLLNMLNERM